MADNLEDTTPTSTSSTEDILQTSSSSSLASSKRLSPALFRCTSTPISGLLPDSLSETTNKDKCKIRESFKDVSSELLKAAERQSRISEELSEDDSGVHSLLFSSSSSNNTSLGAIPKGTSRTTSRCLRSNSSMESSSGFYSLNQSKSSFIERDLFTPKNEKLKKASATTTTSDVVVHPFPVGNFNGKEHLDILRYLNDMSATHLIRKIFSHLRGEDICRVALVSNKWNFIVNSDTEFLNKRKRYLMTLKTNWENSGLEERINRLTPRKAMSNVSNVLVSPSSKRERQLSASNSNLGVISPSKIRHKLFTEEASKLGPGEQLQSCPRCTSPSRVILSECKATCSRISCGFAFCTKCMCENHGDKPCRTPAKSSTAKVSSSSSSNSKVIISSKRSRRRLRRL